MGAVYRATDVRLWRAEAIKVLRSELASDTTEIARFEREAIAVARLHHPGIVQVLDVGREGAAAYLVMEHVQGRTIGAVLGQEGRFASERAADIAEQALFAIAVAHEAGIVHRDIKPGNLMVVPTGGREMVKVLDFGIAQLKTGTAYTRLTQTGAIIGTPAFMAPEQARGEACDGRTDVYAMGVVLWCMLTGRKPFAGRTVAETIEQVLGEVPMRADRVEPSVPAALAALCDVALQKRPDDRYPSASAFAAALVELRQRAPVIAAAVPAPIAATQSSFATPERSMVPPTSPGPSATFVTPERTATLAHVASPPHVSVPPTAPVLEPAVARPARRWSTGQLVIAALVLVTATGLVTCIGGAYAFRRWAGSAAAAPFVPSMPTMPSILGSPDSVCERAVRCCETVARGDASCAQLRFYETSGATGEAMCQEMLTMYERSAAAQGARCE